MKKQKKKWIKKQIIWKKVKFTIYFLEILLCELIFRENTSEINLVKNKIKPRWILFYRVKKLKYRNLKNVLMLSKLEILFFWNSR